MDKPSEAIFSLKPVAFRYKKELEPHGTPQFGLVAEEVAKVSQPFTVRYEEVNAMLLNEFLKEHRKVVEQARTINDQGHTIAQLETEIQGLTTALQKVSCKIELLEQRPAIVGNQ
jgi:hypothetical protein